MNEWIYVFVGESENGTFDANERYSPRLNRWEVMAPMPTARHGLGAAVVDGYLYVLSGGPTPGGSFSNLNEIFVVDQRADRPWACRWLLLDLQLNISNFYPILKALCTSTGPSIG